MLLRLSIKNIVLITACDLSFERGLCVLTGETGAGKSILLDALGLVLGERSEARLVRQGEAQASVSAEFDITDCPLAKAAMMELGMIADNTLHLRRVLTADGKTRCFVNDEPVSVTALRKIGETLVEVHGQHEQRGLLDPSSHQSLLDHYGGLDSSVTATRYVAWKQAETALSELNATIAAAAREEEYLRHMAAELRQLAPEAGEESTLTDARMQMMQGEKLATLLADVEKELMGTKPVDAALATAERMVARSVLNTEERFTPLLSALEKASNEVAEIFSELQQLQQHTSFNADALERLEDRLFALRAAARKYGTEVEGLAGLLMQTEEKLATLSSQQHAVSSLEKEVQMAKAAYIKAATALSEQRKKAAAKLEKAVSAELTPLKMGNVKFRITCEMLEEARFSANGMDMVRFEAATNVTSAKDPVFAPLAKIASGGELSRFMLAMKVALAHVKSTPTFIFDEIDSGTGGAVADAIGIRLATLGGQAQILVVTHLPQVAARGSQHLRIEKREEKKHIVTLVENLSHQDRTEEVARMLAGAEITTEARSAAKKLLQAGK